MSEDASGFSASLPSHGSDASSLFMPNSTEDLLARAVVKHAADVHCSCRTAAVFLGMALIEAATMPRVPLN